MDLLVRDFWPGPLTLVLPVKSKLIPAIARADLPTAAFESSQSSPYFRITQDYRPSSHAIS